MLCVGCYGLDGKIFFHPGLEFSHTGMELGLKPGTGKLIPLPTSRKILFSVHFLCQKCLCFQWTLQWRCPLTNRKSTNKKGTNHRHATHVCGLKFASESIPDIHLLFWFDLGLGGDSRGDAPRVRLCFILCAVVCNRVSLIAVLICIARLATISPFTNG